MNDEHRGTGRWREDGIPHKGWSCIGMTDNGDIDTICEMCSTVHIRYVHHMTHPNFLGELGCGVVCAEHMSNDYVEPRRRQSALVAERARQRMLAKIDEQRIVDEAEARAILRDTFASPSRWKTSKSGNNYRAIGDGIATIFQRDGKFNWVFRSKFGRKQRVWIDAVTDLKNYLQEIDIL